MQSMQDPPWLLGSRSSTVFIIATVWISSFTDYFLYAMVVPILPTALSERAGVPYEDREYWVSVLLMSEAATAFICCPIFGYIVDVAPTRRLPYLLGLIFLGASMGLLAAARSTIMFVTARLLQGGATAMVAVAGLALLTDSVPLDNLGQTIGYQGSAVALGFLLGPLLGGVIYDTAGYQVVFGMAFALVGVDFLMRVAVIEKKVAAKWIDSSASISSPILSARENSGYHTFADNSQPPASLSEAETTNAQAQVDEYDHQHEYGQEQEQEHKPPTLFQIAKQPRVVISSFGLLVQCLLFSAFDATIPIFVESTFNWTPLGAGLAFLPSSITALLEPFFGYISDKQGPRFPTFASFILLPLPLCSLSFITSNTPAHITALLSLLTVIGLLINFATPALFVEAQDVLARMQGGQTPSSKASTTTATSQSNNQPTRKHQAGSATQSEGISQAFGIQTMAQFLGMFLGSLWGGFVEWRFGWQVMVFSLAGLCFVTCWGMLVLGEERSGDGSGSWLGRLGCWFRMKMKMRGREDGTGRDVEGEGLLSSS
ncbi:major facilitator superfamily domain-containing protein [Aspergillus aurantiobrunneus]